MAERWSGYERMARHLAPAADRLAGVVQRPDSFVLDVGSGSGNGLRAASSVGLPVIGLDRDDDQLDAARAIGAPLVRGDAVTLPFRHHAVTSITSNFGIIFAADIAAAFAEVAR
ncbi:MAG: methyltransferase domain-containing protein, partial [Actinomycetota bacterium]